jgi:hypothetical protein
MQDTLRNSLSFYMKAYVHVILLYLRKHLLTSVFTFAPSRDITYWRISLFNRPKQNLVPVHTRFLFVLVQ